MDNSETIPPGNLRVILLSKLTGGIDTDAKTIPAGLNRHIKKLVGNQ